MKVKFLKLIVVFTLLTFSSCDLLNKKDSDSTTQTVQDFSSQVSELNSALENFVMKDQAFENANFLTLKPAQTKQIMAEYIDAGEKFVAAMKKIQETQNQNKSLHLKSTPIPCTPYDFIPTTDTGVGVGLVKSVADIIAETKGDRDLIQAKYDKGEIDDNTYNSAINKLAIAKPIKIVNVGIGAILGTGAAYGAGVAIGTVSLPAIATVAVVGAVVGTTVTWFANWYTGVKSTTPTQQFIITGKTTVGGKLPVHLIGQGATVTLAVQGYAPVVIPNFNLPAAGFNKKIDITPVKLGEAQVGGKTQVCMVDEAMVASSCSAVEFVTGSPSPASPAPYQGVTVTGTIIPKVASCSISFSIIGTDGYSKSASYSTDANGQATFYIPGGAAGVFDKVTITSSNGKTYIVSYTF